MILKDFVSLEVGKTSDSEGCGDSKRLLKDDKELAHNVLEDVV